MTKRVNGEGTITKLKNGRWMGRLTIGRKEDGSFYRKSIYGETKKEVSDKMREVAFNNGIGKCYDPKVLNLKEWTTFWLNNIKKLSLKEKTFEVYEIHINTHIIPVLGHMSLKDLTAMHIQKFVNDKFKSGLASATVRKTFSILNSALKQAVINDILHKNPANGVILPTLSQKQIEVFTPDEQDEFFEHAKGSKLYELFVLAVDTGLRLGEILALTWNDIDSKKGIVSVTKDLICVKDFQKLSGSNYVLKVQDTPKTKSSIRKVPLTSRCVEMLKNRKQASKGTLAFSTKTGNYLAPKNVERAFLGIIKKAELCRCNFHTLRHTFATRMFELNVPTKIVSEYLGHSKVSHTLDIYTHVIPEIKNDAIKVLDSFLESRKSIKIANG